MTALVDDLERVDERVVALAGSAVMLVAGTAITLWRNRVYENKLLTDETLALAKARVTLDDSDDWWSAETDTRGVRDEPVGPDGLTFREREIVADGVCWVDGVAVDPNTLEPLTLR